MFTKKVPLLFKRYIGYLNLQEKAPSTIKKYVHDVQKFYSYLARLKIQTITKDIVIEYKRLVLKKYKPTSINSILISLDNFFKWAGEPELKVKTIRIQRRSCFDHIFSREEYKLLLNTALKHNMYRTYLIMHLLASTGLRISELRYITADALYYRKVVVLNKGKSRTVFIPDAVCTELKEYCRQKGIKSGIIFHSRKPGQLLDKAKIWHDFQKVANIAGFQHGTVHAQNFRHFFAKEYIAKYNDIADLADILGHNSIETTRIYTRTTGTEKKNRIDGLGL